MLKIYDTNEDNSARFTLGEYDTYNSKTLISFGINPSTATSDNYDTTIRKIKAISNNNGYNNWIMLNIYPQRATNPNDLHINPINSLIETNISFIKKVLTDFKNSDILFAYGNLINIRKYLADILRNIISEIKSINWNGKSLCIKLTKQGHPTHPLYQLNTSLLTEFSIDF